MIKQLIITGFSVVLSVSIWAQQEPQYSQYMYNQSIINPAYTGSEGYASVFGLYRAQWVGIEGAPQTSNISYQLPFVQKNFALGFNFLNDRIGPVNANSLNIDFAYTLVFRNNLKLAMGMKGGIELMSIDYSRVSQYNPNDALFQTNLVNQLSPNFGTGLFLYSKKGYIGLSIPMLLQTKFYDGISVSLANRRQHVYLSAGHVYTINPTLKFKPAAILKMTTGAPIQIDLSANMLYNNKINFGVAYRHSAAITALFGVHLSKKAFLGYAFDYETTELAKYNNGSHEIFLKFDFFQKNQRVETPRFF
jgi:type IX secretion system PorP/SprF family membrane protein